VLESPSRPAESSNISSAGICFVSDLPVSVGSQVEIILKMPMEVMGEAVKAMCCRGTVVRVGEPGSEQKTRIIAVQFHDYEVVRDFSEAAEPPQHDLISGWSPT
jgi:hypothetical protein